VAIVKMGIIGLGRMGHIVAYRAVQAGHTIIGYDPSEVAQADARKVGVEIAKSIADIAAQARIFWLMVPSGDLVDRVLDELLDDCKAGDIIIDGGNSNFHNSIKRSERAAQKGVIFLDCGSSGGVRAKDVGFCLMVGGDKAAYTKVHELLAAIAAPGGVAHIGPSGSGHYVKMVHNGIEYAMLQAYAEGFHLIKEGHYQKDNLDLEELARIWNNSSVIRSFILGLTHEIFAEDQTLKNIGGQVAESGMGRWTVQEAHDHNIPVPTIEDALKVRAWSQETGGNFATKVVAMQRNKFGGHAVNKIGEEA
jgi:6-phosphogluconate dehydrogenase